jgi:hypothetical protein
MQPCNLLNRLQSHCHKGFQQPCNLFCKKTIDYGGLITRTDPVIKNREGYRKSDTQVGNSQMYDEKAMDEALSRCMKLGYVTIPEFMIFSGLKRDSAKAYLDSLCKGEHPRLWKVRESRRWLYFPKQKTSKE